MSPCAIKESADGIDSVAMKQLQVRPENIHINGVPMDASLNDSTTRRTPLPDHITSKLIDGTSALGLGIFIERGAGFLANILAARFGGITTFGAYSLAVSTANNISTYAAGGIGATAARFSGKYSYGSPEYSTLARALTIVSLISASLAAATLWFGAPPIAHLLGKQELTSLLRWAAVSASGIILLECARGFFVGQRRLAALVLLSLVVGVGMLIFLPTAARTHSPTRMIFVQGTTTIAAVVTCLLFSTHLGLRNSDTTFATKHLGSILREVWSFGFIQLAGLIGSNLAGWWLTTLVARSDPTLVQMSFFAIASQLRNLVGIVPGLLTEGSYAVMADPGGETTRTPHRVMALCSYTSISVALVLASAGIIFVPWALTLLYGQAYGAAGATVAVGLAIAVVHMGNAPAAARLTIVSIRATGVINTFWAFFVAAAASVFLFHGGSAWQAMCIYFVGHILSSTLVLLTLKLKDHVPAGMGAMYGLATLSSGSLAALALLRNLRPDLIFIVTSIMFVLFLISVAGLIHFGNRYHWLPTITSLRAATLKFSSNISRRGPHV
jgi:O-antigen/teichoic acid export membrane protein